MNLVIFVIVGVLVMSLVDRIGSKYTKPIIKIKSKKKYKIITFSTIIILGVLIMGLLDNEENPVITGACFGIIESLVNNLIGYESSEVSK